MSPSPDSIEKLLRVLFGSRLAWWRRPWWWFKDHTEKGIGPNGGYWGGVFLRALGMVRAAGGKAAAFLRRK